MFGDNSTKLSENIVTNISQITEGLSESMGLDLKALLSAVVGAKIAE